MSDTHQSVEDWARQLRRAHSSTVWAIIRLGQQLLDARADVGRGRFLRLFKGQPNAIPNAVPFSLRLAEYYMLIAKKLGPYSQHVAILPNSLRALLVLCQLQPDVLETAIVQQHVHPAMTEKDAKALLANVPPPKPTWSLDSAEQRLRLAISNEIEWAGSNRLVIELVGHLLDELKEADNQDLRDAVSIARDELDLHDFEPGGYRLFENEQAAATHPGAPAVFGGVKSTYQQFYKDLTTKKKGITPLTRKQFEARCTDIYMGKPPTKRTERTHAAVLWAIKDLARTSPLSRGAAP